MPQGISDRCLAAQPHQPVAETLDFLANFGNQFPVMRPLLSRLERRAEQMHGVRINYAASYWTPPMTPKLAFDLETRQIEKLDLAPMVSITDHDNIKAPMLLRTVPSARQIPVSVEWSAPYGGMQSFHLGVHNLPSARAHEWMAILADYTANPNDKAACTTRPSASAKPVRWPTTASERWTPASSASSTPTARAWTPTTAAAVISFIRQALNNEPLTVFGDGRQTRSLCYVTDLVHGINLTMESDFCEPINLGNPQELTILQIAKDILALIPESKSQIMHHPMPPDDPGSLRRAPGSADSWRGQRLDLR